jgi:uncharacterized protein YqeY
MAEIAEIAEIDAILLPYPNLLASRKRSWGYGLLAEKDAQYVPSRGALLPWDNPRMTTTTPPQVRLEADVKAAMKASDKERLSTLRMLLSAVKNERIARGSEVDEAAFASITRKAIKQREEAAEQYRKGDRPELAEKEEREGQLLAAYLPAQIGEEQIRAAIAALVAERGLAGNAAMGQIMKEMIARFGAAADGAVISRVAREVLNSKP